MLKQNLLRVLDSAINQYLQLDPESRTTLEKLHGKHIAIELQPFNLTFYGEFSHHGIQLTTHSDIVPDVTLRGTPLQLLATMTTRKNRQQFFADDVSIEGNVELGQQIIDLFDHLQIDWEEQLAHITGDAPAYYISNFMRRTASWLRETNASLTANVSDYLHEEAAWLPTHEALNDFFNDIDTLRMDTDRIESKIQQLRSSHTDNGVNS